MTASKSGGVIAIVMDTDVLAIGSGATGMLVATEALPCGEALFPPQE